MEIVYLIRGFVCLFVCGGLDLVPEDETSLSQRYKPSALQTHMDFLHQNQVDDSNIRGFVNGITKYNLNKNHFHAIELNILFIRLTD